jgi:hypothetical protein
MLRARPFILLFLLLFMTPVLAGDPHPPQLGVAFLAEPAPIVQDGSTRLVYEMAVSNFSKSRYVLDSLEAKAGQTRAFFSGSALASIIVRLGSNGKPDMAAGGTIQGGGGAIIFLMLDLGKDQAPGAIEHSLRVFDEQGGAHDVVIAPLPVSSERPIVVAPPLKGEWIAGDSVHNLPDAAHRRAVLIESGHAWVAQRYAIDWVQSQIVDGVRSTWRGPEDKNESYFCYGQPIYSVAAGRVVRMADGAPENVPHSGKYAIAIDFNNAAGNHVVVEIAPDRYVLYAHMRPGTVTVKSGDQVRVGEILGHVGNTGSSTEPHLHMHIDDHPSFLAGNGVPYEFTEGEASGPVQADVSSPGAISFGPVGRQEPFRNDYPANNALVTFK